MAFYRYQYRDGLNANTSRYGSARFPNENVEIMATPSALEIHLFGPFRVSVDGERVEERRFTRRKPVLLLKLLALHPHHQIHREQAMELLWPNSDLKSAINSLNKAIHIARRALEPALEAASDSHFILTHGQHIFLRAPDRLWIDVAVFEMAAAEALKSSDARAYEKAIAIYEGDLLVEDLYEDFVAPRREQLRSLYQHLLANLAELYESRGDYSHSIERLRELVDSDPTNEGAQRKLMRMYALTGDKQKALRQYQLCHEALQKGLDAEPEQATRELREQIRSGRLAPHSSNHSRVETTSRRAIDSLAILPLVNASPDPDGDYFSDGVTESIINNLSQLPQLKVMARSTVFRYKGEDIDPQEVGRRLGVRAVLTGRVLIRGERLNIQAELVDTLDGSQIWGEKYNRDASDIFEVQEEIAGEIAEKLRLRLSGEQKGRLSKRHTGDLEAYHAYLKGRYFWNKRTDEGLRKSIEYFRQAISKDPHYAAAYAGLSDCHTILVYRHGLPAEEGLAIAREAALKALEIDDTLAEAHTSLGHVMMLNWEWGRAGKELERAIELNPGNAFAHQVRSQYLSAIGRTEEALAEIQRAQEIDPLSVPINSNVAAAFYYARRYDHAIEQCRKVIEMDPNFYWSYRHLGRAYEQKGMYDDAIAELVKAVELSQGSSRMLAGLGHAYAVAGRKGDARGVLRRLIAESEHNRASPYEVAKIYAGLGESDLAFEWLEKACGGRDAVMTHVKVTPELDRLRPDLRFGEILRRIGL